MTWDRQLELVEGRVKDAVQGGARVLAGGHRREGRGLYFEPTVLVDCRADMEVMRKETFGPVLPIMRVSDDEEALRLVNDSPFGLMSYVFSGDRARGRRLAERIEAGTVMINDTLLTYAAPETPWHGLKQSGMGRTHSDDGLRDLCQVRHVNYDRFRLPRELWWYPYSNALHRRALRALRLLFG